ncbi:uncharacterized protein LOC125852861 [Solanum stenotomum]|uniref:uncharacterized protein LOC125852861 n=1 Tax=Solanum stenotomum TaxID=172797 RepID=UPI0020D19C40|nr:uncharacterized protein LOC125852861 [Solanum stenotomum]
MEPFRETSEIEQYRGKLGYKNALANSGGKIWILWDKDFEGQFILDTTQQLTIKLSQYNTSVLVTAVYAKCSNEERRELWEDLVHIAEENDNPWIVGGDFNVILREEEKLGGLAFTQTEAVDFAQCLNNCAISELNFSGSMFTWWNGRVEEECIFKRLDRILVNHEFLDLYPSSEVHHLVRQGSDHAPLHMKIATLEDVIKVKEEQLEVQPTQANRAELSKMEAELRKYLSIEEEYWRQKAGMKWFQEGDRNTKFFHSYVRGRRKKLHLERIKDMRGVEISSNEQKGTVAVEYFQDQFSEEERNLDFSILQHIPKLISKEQNEEMHKLPSIEEVRNVVFTLNVESAPGPDGFSGKFFQHCWEIIGEDLTRLVKAFFCGASSA